MKKSTILALTGVLTAGTLLMGCGSSINPEDTVATLNGTPISVGLANYMAQYTAVGYSAYMSYFGETMWSQEVGDDGETLADSVKENILDTLEEYYLLETHMADYGVELTAEEESAMADAAAEFLSVNTAEALKAMGATEEYVKEFLRLNTIHQKMRTAIIADVDTDVPDAECAQKTFSYVRVDKTASDNETEEEISEEQAAAAAKKTAEKILAAAKKADAADDEDALDTAAESEEQSRLTCSYGSSDLKEDENSTYLDLEVLEAADALKDGEYAAEIIETDDSYYVVRMDDTRDEEATEDKRQSIISEREDELYEETIDGYKEAADWSVDEAVWAPVSFDTVYTQASAEDDTDDETEDASEDEEDASDEIDAEEE